MKRTIIFICVLTTVVIVWWLLAPSPSGNSSATNAKPDTADRAAKNSANAATLPAKSKEEQMEGIWNAENNKSQDFYGKVIDQYGTPVEGVRVKAGVGLILGFERSGGNEYFTDTDSNGLFRFVGIKGAGAGYTLTKDGYFFNQRLAVASRPTNHTPDPNHPVIFPIWKLRGAEPMTHTEIQSSLACDGTPGNFDILTGQKDIGNMQATLTRSPVDIDRGKPFDWILSLSISGGGLIEITDPYPNEAPETGYNSVTIAMSADAKNWTPSTVKSYYIFDGKNYGRIKIDLMANYQPPPTHFEIDAYINPSGSRNLEFDPTKVVKRPAAER